MLTLERVGHRYQSGPWLFRDLDWEFPTGTSTSIVGPSGSGKTTLLGIIGGVVSPAEGAIEGSSGEGVAWIFQSPSLVPQRSALDNTMLPLVAQGQRRRDACIKAEIALDAVGIQHLADRAAKTLSGGEAQRVCVARALTGRPTILLADEPTASLDQVSAGSVFDSIRRAASQGMTVIIATHDLRLASRCDRNLKLA